MQNGIWPAAGCQASVAVTFASRKNADTLPERILRKELHRLGYRFRLQRRIAPGVTADLVLPKLRIAVWVDGDFWHGCPEHGVRRWRGPNAERWEAKLGRVKERDAHAVQVAVACGWSPVRLWECEILANPEEAATRVVRVSGPT